ncbi:MAG: BON domain-containing protein, partial [Vicinamibacteria bacterium]
MGKERDYLPPSMRIAALAASVVAAGGSAFPAFEDSSDGGIASAVATELALDEELAQSSLDVAVAEGVVTLTGKVPILLRKERASDVAELVRGVRAVVNRIEIEAPPFSDAVVRNDVTRAIDERYESPSAKRIGVAVEDGTVVLTGVVPSLRDRLRIGEVVQAVTGVRRLDDRLRIEHLPLPSDRELQKSVRRLLGWDSRVDDSDVEVMVAEGAVRLRGRVESAAEKSRAIDLAGIPGVVSVDASGLRLELRSEVEWLRPGGRVETTDDEIERAVEDALFYDPRVRSFNVEVEVEDGIATLQGEVGSLEAKLAAEEDTASVVGV